MCFKFGDRNINYFYHMPLVYQKIWTKEKRLAVWKIEEEESFFINSLSWPKQEKEHFDSLNKKRRIEWLSSRHLICQLSGIEDTSSIIKDSFGKPYLKDSQINISLSHTNGYVSAFIAPQSVGIDVQTVVEKIHRIGHKYLNLEELHAIAPDRLTDILHLQWGAKESLYKSYGRKQLSYRDHIKIELSHINRGEEAMADLYPISFSGYILKGSYFQEYTIEALKIDDAILVYATSIG